MLINLRPVEEPKKIENTRELTDYILDKASGTENMTEDERAKMDAKIMAKLESGTKLSQEELNYLKKTNPMMYAHVMRVQRMAEAVEEQLKHARSKEEADRIISAATSCISKNDPDRKYIFAAVNRISTEFHKSGAYDKLPNTMEEAEKKKNEEAGDVFSDAEYEDDESGFDLMNWSPLKEIYDSMPTFSAGA